MVKWWSMYLTSSLLLRVGSCQPCRFLLALSAWSLEVYWQIFSSPEKSLDLSPSGNSSLPWVRTEVDTLVDREVQVSLLFTLFVLLPQELSSHLCCVCPCPGSVPATSPPWPSWYCLLPSAASLKQDPLLTSWILLLGRDPFASSLQNFDSGLAALNLLWCRGKMWVTCATGHRKCQQQP